MIPVPVSYHAGKPWRPHQHARYGMNCEQFDDLYQAACGRCEICGVDGEGTPSGKLFIDHDVTVGYYGVRGLLCNSCNTRLGLGNHVRYAQSAEAYLAARPWHDGRLIERRQGQRGVDGWHMGGKYEQAAIRQLANRRRKAAA